MNSDKRTIKLDSKAYSSAPRRMLASSPKLLTATPELLPTPEENPGAPEITRSLAETIAAALGKELIELENEEFSIPMEFDRVSELAQQAAELLHKLKDVGLEPKTEENLNVSPNNGYSSKVTVSNILYDPQSDCVAGDSFEYVVLAGEMLPAEALKTVDGYTFDGFYYKAVMPLEKTENTGVGSMILTQGLTKFDPESTVVVRDTELWAIYVKTGSKEAVSHTASVSLYYKAGSTANLTLPIIPSGMEYGAVTNENNDFFTVDEANRQNGRLMLTAAKDFDEETENAPLTFTVNVVKSDDKQSVYDIFVTVTPSFHVSGGSSIINVPVSGGSSKFYVPVIVSGSTATVKDITTGELSKVSGGGSVEIDLSGLKKSIDTAKIPTATVEKIGAQAGMSVKLTTATVEFDKTATQEIADQAKGKTVELVVDDIKEVSLNAVQKEAVGKLDTAIIIDAHLASNGKHLCTEGEGGFGGGKAKVVLPYEIENGRTPANYSVYYVDDAGKLEKLVAKYDTALKAFVFEIEHFSVYAVAYDESACAQDATCVYAKFTDADTKAWYHDGVHFCVANGYMQGGSATAFNPSGTTTCAMIVTMLWRMEGEPVVDYAMSFKDAKAGQWYTEAIRWAQSTKIVEGYSIEAFGPNDPITREQMATILYRYAKYHSIDVANTNTLVGYTDVNKVSSWALDAMKWANAVGLVQGRTTTTLVPEVSITRAEAATMVQRYCEAFKK